MLRRFRKDDRGNIALITALTAMPVLGALAMGVDYAEMTRQRQVTLNALDAAGIATAKQLVTGVTDDQAKAYAKSFFEANLGSVDPANTALTVILPANNTGGGTLKMTARLIYKPYFLTAFRSLLSGSASNTIPFVAQSEIRLKNTLEVALALDNSGSMTENGKGSGKQRMELVKLAAKQLVTTLAGQAVQMKQVAQPVRISLVPFAASVNVGSANKSASWMDTTGLSPVHHENFDWATMTASLNPNKYAQLSGGAWYARGNDWGAQKDKPLTRFALYDLMQRVATKTYNTKQSCSVYYSNGSCKTYNAGYDYTYGPASAWGGCVEARPYPYNVNDTAASTSTPATLFVPMFAPDETDFTDSNSRPANNNWWDDTADGSILSATTTAAILARQKYMPKYFSTGSSVTQYYGMDQGPNASCSTSAITTLTDVTTAAGQTLVNNAIDAMSPDGATNVSEGLAWGWRTVSSGAPFTEGRGDSEKGNDKVVIVLTDGANTYYTPTSVTAQTYSGTYYNKGGNNLAGNQSIYSAAGYTGFATPGYTSPRLFQGTSNAVSKTDYSNANYSDAMNEQFAALCSNAKAGNIILMTVAVDLDTSNTAEKEQIDALTSCASESRFRKNADGTAAKLFWNSTGSSLSDDFKSIANELSNLRIVS